MPVVQCRRHQKWEHLAWQCPAFQASRCRVPGDAIQFVLGWPIGQKQHDQAMKAFGTDLLRHFFFGASVYLAWCLCNFSPRSLYPYVLAPFDGAERLVLWIDVSVPVWRLDATAWWYFRPRTRSMTKYPILVAHSCVPSIRYPLYVHLHISRVQGFRVLGL